jgi:hypothetical protein
MINSELINEFLDGISEPIFKVEFENRFNSFAIGKNLSRGDYYLYKNIVKNKLIQENKIKFGETA